MTLNQELYLMLKDGWNFYQACYRLGITPKEGSMLLRQKGKKVVKITPQPKVKKYTWCGNYHCRYCSDNFCNLRREEME